MVVCRRIKVAHIPAINENEAMFKEKELEILPASLKVGVKFEIRRSSRLSNLTDRTCTGERTENLKISVHLMGMQGIFFINIQHKRNEF